MEKGRKKILVIVLSMIMTCMSVSGCGQVIKENNEEEVESDAIQIGFSMDSFLIERWQRDRDIFVSKAQELGAEVNVQNANGEVSRQISQIEYFIEKEMDVIVIVAIDGNSLTEVVEKAKRAGIKVIAYDRLILNADVDLYISFDNKKVGTLMGEYLRKMVGEEGTIIRVNGSPSDHNVTLVTEGFEEALSLRKRCRDPGSRSTGQAMRITGWRRSALTLSVNIWRKIRCRTVLCAAMMT